MMIAHVKVYQKLHATKLSVMSKNCPVRDSLNGVIDFQYFD